MTSVNRMYSGFKFLSITAGVNQITDVVISEDWDPNRAAGTVSNLSKLMPLLMIGMNKILLLQASSTSLYMLPTVNQSEILECTAQRSDVTTASKLLRALHQTPSLRTSPDIRPSLRHALSPADPTHFADFEKLQS